MRPDLRYVDVRGNVDTRLRKLRDGEYDAIVLACAGLGRLGASARYTIPFEPTELVPATGQGALAVETRADCNELASLLREAVNDAQAERAVFCERAALRTLHGGCQAPIGIYARYEGGSLIAEGIVCAPDGRAAVRECLRAAADSTAQAETVGITLAHSLLERGAAALCGGGNPA